MLNDNAKKWVAALRSGKYKQGTRYLTVIKNGKEFDCCLGVACKLYMEEGNALQVEQQNSHLRYIPPMDEGGADSGVLPVPVRKWLGLTFSNGNSDSICLSSLNDNGKSFEEIAKVIESEPEGLFK